MELFIGITENSFYFDDGNLVSLFPDSTGYPAWEKLRPGMHSYPGTTVPVLKWSNKSTSINGSRELYWTEANPKKLGGYVCEMTGTCYSDLPFLIRLINACLAFC